MTVNLHSVEGAEALKNTLRTALTNRYRTIAESMFVWTLDDNFSDMLSMTHNEIPERFLFDGGKCCTFRYADQLYFARVGAETSINIYGNAETWMPTVVGTSPASNRINQLKLDRSDSVIVYNNKTGTGDSAVIAKFVEMLIDNIVTMNQLQILARSPYIFRINKDNLLTVKNFYLNLAEGRPVMYLEKSIGDEIKNVLERSDVKIDPSLFELYDRIECLLMEQLGLECVPITKRAQQSIAEVESNHEKIFLVKQDKLEQRQKACEEINAIYGCNISVKSALDQLDETFIEQYETEDDIEEEEENDE